MKALGIAAPLRAAVLGVSASTLRRWRGARRADTPAAPPRSVPPEARATAENVVRELRGNIGAAALAVATGLSRRVAAEVKSDILTAIEVERKAAAGAVSVTVPAAVRGFDAMVLNHGYVLASCDAAIPYRTSLCWASRYDVEAVIAALEADFKSHGAPLVLRLDQARQHKAEAVYAMLRDWRVQPLHGPPHHPQYYGQLERQNREHRAWLRGLPDDDVPGALPVMQRALNAVLPRRVLGWRTAEAIWDARGRLGIDRDCFFDEVERGARRARSAHPELNDVDARRLAIHRALTHHGLLKLRTGGKC